MAFLCPFSVSSSFSSVDVIGPGGGLVLCSLHGIPVEYSSVRREKQSLHYSAPRLARNREKARKNFQESSTYGRVNEGEGENCLKSRRFPIKRTACAYGCKPGVSVLNICNTTTGEICAETCPPSLSLQN